MTLIREETYPGGGSYFEWDDGSYEEYDGDGNLIASHYAYALSNQPSNTVPILDSIGRWISNVTGNFAPPQGQYYPAVNYQGNPLGTRPQPCNGVLIGGSVNALGGGTSGGFCVTKNMLIIGSIAAGFFLLGKKRR